MKLASAKLLVILLTVAGFVAVGAVLAFMFVPTFKEITRLSDEIIAAHAELEAQYVNRKNLLSSGAKVNAVRGTVSSLTTQFLPTGRELDFITAVEGIADRNGVSQRIQLTIAESGQAAAELKVTFDISLDGTTPNVLRTLLDLERMSTLLVVDTLTMRPSPGRAGSVSDLSINLRGTVPAPPIGL